MRPSPAEQEDTCSSKGLESATPGGHTVGVDHHGCRQVPHPPWQAPPEDPTAQARAAPVGPPRGPFACGTPRGQVPGRCRKAHLRVEPTAGQAFRAGTVALSRNAPGKPSNVEALLHGRTPRKGRTTRPCHDLSSLSGEVEAVARGDRSMQQCRGGRGPGARAGPGPGGSRACGRPEEHGRVRSGSERIRPGRREPRDHARGRSLRVFAHLAPGTVSGPPARRFGSGR
jgi:hypothetical protein